MKISHKANGATLGELAVFVQHALRVGGDLSAPVTMTRARSSEVTEMSVDVDLPQYVREDGDSQMAADDVAREIERADAVTSLERAEDARNG